MADRVDHTHGDTGAKPVQDLNFQTGGFPDPEVFDWFWTEVPAAINDHADQIEALGADSNGVVDEAEYAQDTDSFKGNDLDSNGDGKVDYAETADQADNATTVKGNDIDTDSDGRVDAADHANQADNATTVKGNDIDSDGNGVVDRADVADSASHDNLTNVRGDQHHSRYTDIEASAAAPVQSVNGATGAVTVNTYEPTPFAQLTTYTDSESGTLWTASGTISGPVIIHSGAIDADVSLQDLITVDGQPFTPFTQLDGESIIPFMYVENEFSYSFTWDSNNDSSRHFSIRLYYESVNF